MGTLNDAGLKLLNNSHSFQVNTNFSYNGPFNDPVTQSNGVKRPLIDEFVRELLFERYDLDTSDIVASRPETEEPDPAYLPGAQTSILGTTNTGLEAYWYSPSGVVLSMQLRLETAVDPDYETFVMRRLGTMIEIDRMQLEMAEKMAGKTKGPELIPTLIRTASIGVVRELSRTALNGVDPGTSSDGPFKMLGLAKYYDDQFGGAGNDPQVFKASNPLTLAQVRYLCRLVTPSEDGFGEGPNALVMSWRTRDLLIGLERTAGSTPMFILEPETRKFRYYFEGIPVYIAPVREDEDDTGSEPLFPEQEGGTAPSPYTYDKTSIYAMRLGGTSGVRMLHFGGESSRYGVQVEKIAPTTGTAALGYKVHGFYTLFIPERQAVARLWGVDLSTVP